MRPAISNRGIGVPSGACVFNPQLPGEVLGQIGGTGSTSRGKWVGGQPETRGSAEKGIAMSVDGGKPFLGSISQQKKMIICEILFICKKKKLANN